MKRRRQELLLTLPSLAWLVVFFAIPAVLILAIAFRPGDLRGGVGEGWTLETVKALGNPIYLPVMWRTFWLSAATTLSCLALALPMCWHMARVTPRWRHFLLLLIVLPFLTNFLIRVFAWKSLLHPEGLVKQALVWLHLASEDTLLLNNAGAVLLVLIYTQLPFAILPLYAAAEKFDFTLLDAARDLGATGWQAFRKVFVPGIRQGIVAAAVIVLVSSLGQYVIPQIVGGTGDEMIGNKIAQRAFSDRNLPLASALSGALLLIVLIPTLRIAWRSRKEGRD
ncbi:MAG: ABC transporter permease [Prosthecobacter sp.]|nr:ABC transporter permease [Prosthecobacter sp.]